MNSAHQEHRKVPDLTVPVALALIALMSSCTKQADGSFRFLQQQQTFSTTSTSQVDTKIDILWVVDNSSSMDASQAKLRQGFSAFATKYMKPTWDIRAAVITTDTYMAHSGFSSYLNSSLGASGSRINESSTYINSRLSTFVNTSYIPNLVNTSTGRFTRDVKIKDLAPNWDSNYAKLLAGKHDGPTTAFCFEFMPYFQQGVTECARRDLNGVNNGTAKCLSPNGAAGETTMNMCVNTVQNDTVRSGKAIIKTTPPAGTPADAAWTNQLISDFTVNITTGSSGHGSERGLGSVLQLLSDNESTPSAFFRPGSLRLVVFVSDEEDQTMTIPTNVPSGFNPYSNYACDLAGLQALNPGSAAAIAASYCCTGSGCRYGSAGTTCAAKTVDGLTYTPSICADPTKLVAVSSVKTTLDQFFRTLDNSGAAGNPNYFVASIVPLTANTIQTLQAARDSTDTLVGAYHTQAVDRGDRYLQLGTLVGNGSLSMDIGVADYSPILTAIGNAIVEKKGTFVLARAASGQEDMIMWVVHQDGSRTVVPESHYTVNGTIVQITNVDFILGLSSTDQILIDYQPASAG